MNAVAAQPMPVPDPDPTARRDRSGLIRVQGLSRETLWMNEAAARQLLEQLAVAIHCPPPERDAPTPDQGAR